ncbi:glycosyltransferase family 39 protein [Candidatus Sumerlaeota bacterium]|nr:glycosyltransferase family 39 protein [Candidatus Sumerlaeota bacterium]
MRLHLPVRDWRWWAIFAAGLLLRAMQPGLVQYGIDEGTATAMALQISHGVHFSPTGLMTSFGFHNPPLFLYLLAPLTWLTIDPRSLGLCFAVAGSTAIFFGFDSARRLSGHRAGLLAAAIIAFCPNAVEHSRRIWGHDLIVLFASVTLWCAIVAHEKRAWRFLAGSFCAAIAAQCVHLSGIVLWVIPLSVMCGFDGKQRGRAIIAAVVLLVMCYGPWLIADAQNQFREMRLVCSLIFCGATQSLGMPVSPHTAWALVLSDFWTNDLLGAPRPFMVSRTAMVASLAQTTCALALLGIAIAGATLALVRGSGSRVMPTALLLGIVCPLILFGIVFRAAVPPYLLPVLVPAAVAAACTLTAAPATQRVQAGSFTFILLYVASSTALIAATRAGIMKGLGTSIPATEKIQAIDMIAERSPSGTAIVLQDGRQRKTGIDVAYVVLAHERALGLTVALIDETPLPIHVIVDHRTRLRPPVANFLDKQESIELPHLSIKTIAGRDRATWTALVDRFPAQMPAR